MLDNFTLGMASSMWFVVYVLVPSRVVRALQPTMRRQDAMNVKASSCPKPPSN
jgi:hypothetical protein